MAFDYKCLFSEESRLHKFNILLRLYGTDIMYSFAYKQSTIGYISGGPSAALQKNLCGSRGVLKKKRINQE